MADDADLLARIAAFDSGPATEILRPTLQAVDGDKGWVRLAFDIDDRLTNSMGAVQGGFVAAMLDEVMFDAILAHSDLRYQVPTLELKTSFLRPVFPGTLISEGWVLRRGRSTVFTEGKLWDADGALLATASATSTLRELK